MGTTGYPAAIFAVAGKTPSISLRIAMPCQCADVGPLSRFLTVIASSSPIGVVDHRMQIGRPKRNLLMTIMFIKVGFMCRSGSKCHVER